MSTLGDVWIWYWDFGLAAPVSLGGKQVVSPCGVVTSGTANLNLALLAVYPDNSPSFSVWFLALVGVCHGTCLMIHDRAK